MDLTEIIRRELEEWIKAKQAEHHCEIRLLADYPPIVLTLASQAGVLQLVRPIVRLEVNEQE